MIKRDEQSKNIDAEKILGKRSPGTSSFQMPFELDYFCPICSSPPSNGLFLDNGDLKPEYERLHFSEYNGFMWCENCNIDIPSFLCLYANSKEAVEIYTRRFLTFMERFRERIYEPLSTDEIELQKLRILNEDLKKEIELLKKEIELQKTLVRYLNTSFINRIKIRIFNKKSKERIIRKKEDK